MMILAFIVLGLEGLNRMPWDLNPDVEIPVVSVTVPYPGAGPEEIEQRILRPLEDEVSVINGVTDINGTAYENIASLVVLFDYEIDIDVAAADVRDAMNRAGARFPEDADEPSLYKIDLKAFPVLTLGVTGQRSARDLRKLVDDQIKPRLGQVPGVAAINVSGGQIREIQVLAHKARLDAVGLSISQLAQILSAENLDVPAGNVKEGMRDYAVRVLGEFESIDEIKNIQVNTPAGGLVLLSTLADVVDTVEEPTRFARVDCQDSITVGVVKQSDANTVKVVEGALEELSSLVGDIETAQGTGELPSDIRLVIAEDESERVRESIKDVLDALMFGALLAALVVFLFLHNFRGTIIVALAIPTSMISTFLITGTALGFSLNTMVMLALSLSVGILVDDSIVVLENIDRHLRRGEQPKAAAYNGRTEIGAAALGITSVDVVVFIPVALMGGIVGQFFFAFGITAATCTLFSLLISFSMTPMLASWWYTRREKTDVERQGLYHRFVDAWEGAYAWLEHRYARILRTAVAHPYIAVTIAYLVLVLIVATAGKSLGFEFFPVSDEGKVTVSLEAASGTRIETTDALTQEIEARLSDKSKYPEIEHINSMVGAQGSGFMGAGGSGGQYAQINITMYRRRARLDAGQRSDEQLAKDLRSDLADLPDVMLKVNASSGGPGGGADVELKLVSEDQDKLFAASEYLAAEVAKLPGLRYVELSSEAGRPEIHCKIDRRRAADLGLSAAQIGMAVRTAIDGDTSSQFRESGDEYDLRVQFAEIDRQNVHDVSSVFVGVTAMGQPVRLRDVAGVYLSTGPSNVERFNRQRSVTLSAYLDTDVLSPGAAQKVIGDIMRGWDYPGVSQAWAGSLKMQRESFGFLFSALALAILLVYIVTAALYNSILQPLIILLCMPMAICGGILGLFLTGSNISIVAMIGFIMLIGLVGKNAILVVDYTNTLRARGKDRRSALLEAGPARMKPVLMTTAATVMGMSPTALAVNEGSEWRSPMAWVVIFGLLVSTLISLLVVPSMYSIFDEIGNFFGRLGRGFTKLAGLGKRDEDEDDDEPPTATPPEPLPPVDPAREAPGEDTARLPKVVDPPGGDAPAPSTEKKPPDDKSPQPASNWVPARLLPRARVGQPNARHIRRRPRHSRDRNFR